MSEDLAVISDDELLFRRIPVSTNWFENGILRAESFRPSKHDQTGISLTRACLKTAEDAATGKSSKGYFLAEVSVGDLKRIGLTVKFEPHVGEGKYDPSHVEIPELRYDVRRSDECFNTLQKIIEPGFIKRMLGPYGVAE